MKLLLDALVGMLVVGENGNKRLRTSGLGLLLLCVTVPISIRYGAQLYAQEVAFRSDMKNVAESAKGTAENLKAHEAAQEVINTALLEEIELHGEFLRELLIAKGKDPSRIENRWRLRKRLGVAPTR